MTFQTTKPQSWTCRLTKSGSVYTIASPSGGKSISVDVRAARKAGVTTAELDVLARLGEAKDTVVLDRDEMLRLVAVRDKLGATQAAPVAATANGTAQTVAERSINRSHGSGGSNDEFRLTQLEGAAAKLENETLYMLIYDIPSALGEECPNPSTTLWRYGFRLNLSCWVLPESSLSRAAVKELLGHWQQFPGVQVHIIPFAPEAQAQILQIARAKLAAEILRVHTSLIERIANASARLEAAKKALAEKEAMEGNVSVRDYERASARKDNEVRSILKGSAEALNATIACARLFDDSGETADLITALRQSLIAEQRSFNAQMAAKGGKGSDVKV
jgi:hypothetical protein